MLVVDPQKRFTVDKCLAHPWMTARVPSVNDSTGGLVGGFAGLEVNRRGVVRERTLLASLNSVEVTRIPGPGGKGAVEIHKKNSHKADMEARPFDARNPEEFLALGGKGDQELFGNDSTSRYTIEDAAGPGPATATKNGNGNHKQKPRKGSVGGKAVQVDKGDQQ